MFKISYQNESSGTKVVVEIGIVIALAVALSTITRLIQLPWGGSISIGSVPIAIFCLLRGSKAGVLVGALYGVVDLMLNPFIVHPAQVLLDYPIPNALFGCLIGFLHRLDTPIRLFPYVLIISLAGCAKWFSHWISGILYFGAYAPVGQEVWIYSAIYNASHVIPETILCIVLLRFLVPYIPKRLSEL